MDVKRILTSVIGLPAVLLIFILGNEYVIDAVVIVASIICMHEYFNAIQKVSKPIKWVGYLSTIFMPLIVLIQDKIIFLESFIFFIPIIILILFLHIIITEMKITFKDVAYTLIGIMYIPVFLMFIELIRCLDNGKILIGYVFVISWSTDIAAYMIGRNFGKHKFSKISPKKSIEGCIAGLIGAVLVSLIYTYIAKTFWNIEFSYMYIGIMALILSAVSQIGDFVASSIKRFVDVKDYSNLLPGHGGLLDRIDSLIFIAPFAYVFFNFIINNSIF